MSDVFLSYSRRDIAFARLLYESLQQEQLDTWIDWDRIPIGEDWWKNICEAIDNSNVFLFLISQRSVNSSICKNEIDRALANNKRIIPVLMDDLDTKQVAEFLPQLPKLNWIILKKGQHFSIRRHDSVSSQIPEEEQVTVSSLSHFQDALHRLNEAIHTDWEWVKAHKSLLIKSLEWERNRKHPDFLLRGKEYRNWESVLTTFLDKSPKPSELMVEFVDASKDERKRFLGNLRDWYMNVYDKNAYHAPDFDVECAKCGHIHTFTPSDRLPMPQSCPKCGFGRDI